MRCARFWGRNLNFELRDFWEGEIYFVRLTAQKDNKTMETQRGKTDYLSRESTAAQKKEGGYIESDEWKDSESTATQSRMEDDKIQSGERNHYFFVKIANKS